MAETLASPFLEYGTLGVLALFIASFVYTQWRRDAAADQARKEANEQRAHERQEFRAQQAESDAYLRGLIDRQLKEQDAHLASWQEMTKETLSAYKQVADAYDGVTKALEANCAAIANGDQRSHTEHAELGAQISQVLAAVEGGKHAAKG